MDQTNPPAAAESPGRAATVLAVLGVVAGLAIALAGLIEPAGIGAPGSDVVAWVNGRPIPSSRFDFLAGALNDERRGAGRPPLEDEEILRRLIEEELLVDYAVDLGLPYSDKIARGYLVNGLLAMIGHEAMHTDPTDDVLERFFNENPQMFSSAGQVSVQFLFVDADDQAGRDKAETLRKEWERRPPGAPKALDPLPIDVPQSLVPVGKLADYLGGELAGTIAGLAVGETTPPAPWMGGWVVARLVDRAGGGLPSFDEVRPRALEAYRRRLAESEYARTMDKLRAMADIRVLRGNP